MMDRIGTDISKLMLWAVAAAWLIAVGWQQFSTIDSSYLFKSAHYVRSAQDMSLHEKLANNICKGSYAQRYECRGDLKRANEQRMSEVWGKKFLIVCGPPFALFVLYQLLQRRSDQSAVPHQRRPAT